MSMGYDRPQYLQPEGHFDLNAQNPRSSSGKTSNSSYILTFQYPRDVVGHCDTASQNRTTATSFSHYPLFIWEIFQSVIFKLVTLRMMAEEATESLVLNYALYQLES